MSESRARFEARLQAAPMKQEVADDHHRIPAVHRRSGPAPAAERPSRTSTPTRARSWPPSPPGPVRTPGGPSATAEAAFPAWSQTPPAERQRVFLAAADILERRGDEVVGLLARETGRVTYGFGMFQMGFVPGLLRQAAALAYSPIGQILPSDLLRAMAMGLRRPVGVVGAISLERRPDPVRPLLRRPLALGNTVVAKPSEESLFVGTLWGEIFAEAGLPDGVLNIVTYAPARPGPSARSWSRTRRSGGSASPARPPPAASWPRPPAATSSGWSWSWAATTCCWCSTTPTSTTPWTPAPSGRSCTRGRSACRPGACWSTGGGRRLPGPAGRQDRRPQGRRPGRARGRDRR